MAESTLSWPSLWGSAWNRPRAWPRCITYFAGWRWMPSKRSSAAGPGVPGRCPKAEGPIQPVLGHVYACIDGILLHIPSRSKGWPVFAKCGLVSPTNCPGSLGEGAATMLSNGLPGPRPCRSAAPVNTPDRRFSADAPMCGLAMGIDLRWSVTPFHNRNPGQYVKIDRNLYLDWVGRK